MSALDGRHVLVAGVREPDGRALAVALAEAGASVSVTTRRAELSEEVTANSILNECWTFGGEGRALTLDLTDEAAVASALEALEADLAPLDAVVTPLPPADPPDALVAAAAERMAARGGGVVVLPAPTDAVEALRAASEPRGVVVVGVDAGGDVVAVLAEALGS
ncbi:MAG: SDR family NAD(P)-dependent oxidoreductase [Chloroflexi bacterium]|nr:SDR family NAD(P)-dependent oxidoreductase [Chloroflexota bacterium]